MTTLQFRPPAVAGTFYPGTSQALSHAVVSLLATVRPSALRPKALIVPHAGFPYSGPVAASAYATLSPLRETLRRVLLLGPAHRMPVKGLALSSAAAFASPLGLVPLDRAAADTALVLPQVKTNDPAHAGEHSLEVQLPFLQTLLADFRLLPLLVGEASAAQVAQVLDLLWGGPETLILVSSDLSHYLPYDEARRRDGATSGDILHLRPLEDPSQACGAAPVNGLLEAARRHGLKPSLLDLRNSGDTAGDRERVVGYGAFAFAAEP